MWGDKRRDWGSLSNFTLGHVYAAKREYDTKPEERRQFVQGDNWVCGFVLPPFQRPLVWDEGRMIRFIESAAEGLNLGTWSYHQSDDSKLDQAGNEYFPREYWLIDGQQRLTAFERFFDNKLQVFGNTWEEIDTIVRKKFLNQTAFPAMVLRNRTELDLREFYDLLNFGGINHEPDQRALPGFGG
jgi:hypothetical protein